MSTLARGHLSAHIKLSLKWDDHARTRASREAAARTETVSGIVAQGQCKNQGRHTQSVLPCHLYSQIRELDSAPLCHACHPSRCMHNRPRLLPPRWPKSRGVVGACLKRTPLRAPCDVWRAECCVPFLVRRVLSVEGCVLHAACRMLRTCVCVSLSRRLFPRVFCAYSVSLRQCSIHLRNMHAPLRCYTSLAW